MNDVELPNPLAQDPLHGRRPVEAARCHSVEVGYGDAVEHGRDAHLDSALSLPIGIGGEHFYMMSSAGERSGRSMDAEDGASVPYGWEIAGYDVKNSHAMFIADCATFTTQVAFIRRAGWS